MILRQLLHTTPVIGASCLFGCVSKSACCMDPMDEPRSYIELARELRIRITHVVDTHVHADHLSTGRDLAAVANADRPVGFGGYVFAARTGAGAVRPTVMHETRRVLPRIGFQ